MLTRLINKSKLINLVANSNNTRYLSGFSDKHTNNNRQSHRLMLDTIKASNINSLINEIVPNNIVTDKIKPFPAISEMDSITKMKNIARKNKLQKNLIGLDFNDAILPPILQRKILENPKWYTSYTPYQSEISQGRLEAQFNFQTLITELTGMDVANISLLDSGSAATEALNMSYNITKGQRNTLCPDKDIG